MINHSDNHPFLTIINHLVMIIVIEPSFLINHYDHYEPLSITIMNPDNVHHGLITGSWVRRGMASIPITILEACGVLEKQS